MYFQTYGYQLHKQCVSTGRIMWRKWDLRRSCTNYNLTLYQQSCVVLLLVSCNLHVTSEARAKHIPMFYTAKWMSDRAMQAYCQASHASSVMANYNWQLMLEDGQVQTDASWQNYPDHQCVPESWTLPCNQHTPWGEGLPLLMQYLPRFQWDSHRAHCCSCYQGVSQKLWSTWYINVTLFSPTFCHWPYWPPGFQPECREWHGVTVILGGQQCPAGSGMQIVVCPGLCSFAQWGCWT